MGVTLENLGILMGLSALAIPVVIHLLRRRRFEVIDWGAMQFLPAYVATRRRRLLEELLLLAVRLSIIVLIVLALASPSTTNPLASSLSDRPARDIVLVFDGSFSMDRRETGEPNGWRAAREWAQGFVAHLGRAERVAVIVARQPPLLWQDTFTSDRSWLTGRVEQLPAPTGNPGLPAAVARAWTLLRERSEAPLQDIVVLTDRQHYGWEDATSRLQWDTLARQFAGERESTQAGAAPLPRLRVIDVGQAEPPSPNYALLPLTVSRGLVTSGAEVRFRTSVRFEGFPRPIAPASLRVEIAGKQVQNLSLPSRLEEGQRLQVPITFTHRFETPGTYLVSVILEPGETFDAYDADNRQHAVVEVAQALPVLLVDAEPEFSAESSTFFLMKALEGSSRDNNRSTVQPRVRSRVDLEPGDLRRDKEREPPRVVILSDVPTLSSEQQESIASYLSDGGSLLVTLGPRSRAVEMNERLFKAGKGWLPARLVETPTQPAVQPELKSFVHPALDLFRQEPEGTLGQLKLARWWKVSSDSKTGAAPIAMLSNGDPLLVEKTFGKGRVILCTVPMDRGWDSPLPGLWEFPVLVHELIYYLAGARSEDWRLTDGAALRLALADSRSFLLTTPEEQKTFQPTDWPWTYTNTGAIGVYHIQRSDQSSSYYIVPPDPREAESKRCDDATWQRILQTLPTGDGDSAAKDDEAHRRHELWWFFLLGVVALLCIEVFTTRRLVLKRGR